jgi:DNA polymerase (family 10)
VLDNYAIADQFSLLAKLMDIHGENPFKTKSYTGAALTIEKLPQPLAAMNEALILKVKGIGDSVGKKVIEILQTGELKALQEIIQQTPEGVLEMMNIKGLGSKKINVLWKEMGIATIEELETACRENRVAAKKGFGEKTEQKILESIEFVRSSRGKSYYKHVEDFVLALQAKLEGKFPGTRTEVTGEFRRQLPVISKLEWVTTIDRQDLKDFLLREDAVLLQETDEILSIRAGDHTTLLFHFAVLKNFTHKLFLTSGSEAFLSAWEKTGILINVESEEAMFEKSGLHFIPPYLRESATVLERARKEDFADVVQANTIKGLIHSHSNWSDGSYTIEQMAEELIRLGFEYLVISDHSKAANYANGLTEDRIREQHKYIDELNRKLAPFKIFKSIECDILGDGTLDYDDQVLSSFDLVITSVHSNLDMDQDKAMMRLMGAITNPYTTILGHMTGRLLLRRKGYPVDHKAIIDACAKHNVVIEINAAPSRLDIDWQWISYALEKGVLLSINPDAHALDEFSYIKYGTLVAQKGGLPASKNLSSFSLKEFENYLTETRQKKRLNK